MPQLIGMDEAGYGPNLGPLVITATCWSTPGPPQRCDLWRLLCEVIAPTAAQAVGRLHVADSKEVYSPAKGLQALELSVLTILQTGGVTERSFRSLWRRLAVEYPADDEQEPWFAEHDVTLPVCVDECLIAETASRLGELLDRCGIGRPCILSDLVLTRRFNLLAQEAGSKGRMLSSLSMSLLQRAWKPPRAERAFVICDKHGGRNRYDELLADVLDGQMIFRMREGRDVSVYRVGVSEVHFQTRAEAHFPVAVASLVSKYLRELAMLAFNDFWRTHLPDVKPTKGYPSDARRFYTDIAATQAKLRIADEMLWRCR